MPPVSSMQNVSTQQMPDMSMGMTSQINQGIPAKSSMGGAWPGQGSMGTTQQNPMSNVATSCAMPSAINTAPSMAGGAPPNIGIPGPDQSGGNALQNRNIIWKGKI